jgi:hypothetical protein
MPPIKASAAAPYAQGLPIFMSPMSEKCEGRTSSKLRSVHM